MTKEKEKDLVNMMYVWFGLIMVIALEALSGFLKSSLTNLFSQNGWFIFAGMFIAVFSTVSVYAYRVFGHLIIGSFTDKHFNLITIAYSLVFIPATLAIASLFFYTF